MSDPNPSAPGFAPDTLEQFFASLAQSRADSAGTPMVATEPAPPPALPTSAPPEPIAAPAPVASAPVPEEAPSLEGQIDPETLAAIQAQARGSSPTSSKLTAILQAIAHAARVMADPSGTAASDEREAKGVIEARKLLADLQQNAYAFHKASLQSKQQGDAATDQLKKARIAQNGAMLRDAYKDVGGQTVPEFKGTLDDEDAVQKHLTILQPLRQQAAKDKARAEALNQIDDNILNLAKNGMLPDDPALAKSVVARKMVLTGLFTEAEATQAVEGLPALAMVSKIQAQYASLRNQQTEANTKLLNARSANIDALATKARKDLQGGGSGLRAIQSANATINALRAEGASAVQAVMSFQRTKQGNISALQSGVITKEEADYNIAQAETQIAAYTEVAERTRNTIADLEQQIQPYSKKLDFVNNVPTLSYNALQQLIESDPKLYANPQTVLTAIAMPGTNPIKSIYWMRLMTQIRLEYGDNIGLRDIYDAMEQQVYSMANPAMAGQPGAPTAAAGILNPQQELQLGANAKQEAAARTPKGPSKPAPTPPQGAPYTQGIGAKIGEFLQNAIMPTPPSEETAPEGEQP